MLTQVSLNWLMTPCDVASSLGCLTDPQLYRTLTERALVGLRQLKRVYVFQCLMTETRRLSVVRPCV